jgi:hypothetical protein
METLEIEEEVVLVDIPDRSARIDSLIRRLMSHETHLSYSALKAFKDSPVDFIQYKFREKKQTDAMVFGLIVHCLILEPEEFDNRYAIMEDADICAQIGGAKPRSTNAYKAWKEVYLMEIGDRTIVSLETYNVAKSIAVNVKHNRASAKILNMLSVKEKAVKWEYKNFMFLGFLDGEGDKLIVDVKTCKDANPKKFQRDIISMSYYLQAAMYLTAVRVNKPYYILAVDKKGGISVHRLHKHLIEQGLEEYSKLLDQFNKCILMDGFDMSYDFHCDQYDGIHIMDKPAYMY